jgi:hypothetical protein
LVSEHRLNTPENRVLGRKYEPKRHEEEGNWRKQHNEELHNLYSSPRIIGLINPRRMKWAGHEETLNAYGFLWKRQKGRGQ